MSQPPYDLAILGAGPGGYVAAIRAGQLGLRVALIERDLVGGVCLNRGCIPSKALISNAEVLSIIRHAHEYGITVEGIKFDYARAVARSRTVVQRLQKGILHLLKKHRVELVQGTGRFLGPGQIQVEGPQGLQEVRTRSAIIASGTRVKLPAGVRVDGRLILTSDEALFLETLPRSIAILGAGSTGVEFAYVFSVYGVAVTLVEFKPQILPTEDTEAVTVIARRFQREGIRLLTGTAVEAIRPGDRSVVVELSSNGRRHQIETESVLVAMGRLPNTENLGLDRLGIALRNGFIQTGPDLQTTIPGVYAIGDVAGKALLAHSAMAEGIFVAERLAGKNPTPLDYRYVPRCTYCQPQLAAIGLTEEEARERHKIRVGKFPFTANGKALAAGEGEGFAKVISEAETGEILGVHLVGSGVTELISEVSLARLLEASVEEVRRAIHPHPTLSEALVEAAAAAADQAIHS